MIYDIQHLVDAMKDVLRFRISQNGTPRLDIVKTSDDFASKKYIGNKIKLGQELGVNVRVIRPDEMETSEADGIIVQLPVGEQWDEKELISRIPKEKDVDGFHPEHLGEIMKVGSAHLEPCTALGVVQILNTFFNQTLEGKNIVIINRSNIVGKPLAMMLIARDATVTVCHSKTVNLMEHTKNADVVVTAVGKRDFITPEMLKKGALVVDVSINRNDEGKVCGDASQALKESPDHWVTPVPRGVGQLTVLNLLYNTHRASIQKGGM